MLLVSCMWLLPATTLLAQVPMYTGVDLPVSFVPTAINASGQMAGYGTASGGSVHAMVYSNGNLIDLGVLPGGDHSEARAINALAASRGAKVARAIPERSMVTPYMEVVFGTIHSSTLYGSA